MNLIQDLPKGPLDVYRKRASFNWKSLKFNLFGEDLMKFQVNLCYYNKIFFVFIISILLRIKLKEI